MPRRLVLLSVALAIAAAAASQTTGSRLPQLVPPSLTGHDLYDFYCASCHGRDGRGAGPVAPALRSAPTNLTQLALHNGGVFPQARVQAYVTNDAGIRTAAHGTSEMPVWGPIFRSLDPSDTMVRIRIGNIVAYLESIQERPSH